MASRLLCCAFVLSSCLLPQNDDPLPDFPAFRNRPPRIDPDAVQPARVITVNLANNCPPTTAEARVDDFDTDDLIRVRWLVYRDDGTQQGQSRFEGQNIPSNKMVRRQTITAPKDIFSLSVLGTTGTGRRLDLIVGDGEFSEDGSGKLTTLPRTGVKYTDGGDASITTYLDTYTWIVDTINDPVICP